MKVENVAPSQIHPQSEHMKDMEKLKIDESGNCGGFKWILVEGCMQWRCYSASDFTMIIRLTHLGVFNPSLTNKDTCKIITSGQGFHVLDDAKLWCIKKVKELRRESDAIKNLSWQHTDCCWTATPVEHSSFTIRVSSAGSFTPSITITNEDGTNKTFTSHIIFKFLDDAKLWCIKEFEKLNIVPPPSQPQSEHVDKLGLTDAEKECLNSLKDALGMFLTLVDKKPDEEDFRKSIRDAQRIVLTRVARRVDSDFLTK